MIDQCTASDLKKAWKKIRNKCKEGERIESLFVIWAYGLFACADLELPKEIERWEELANKKHAHFQIFQLLLYVREIVSQGGLYSRRSHLKSKNLSKLLNAFQRASETAFCYAPEAHSVDSTARLSIELFRMAHQQFHWQQFESDLSEILSIYHFLYSDEDIAGIVEESTGFEVVSLLRAGLHIHDKYLHNFSLRIGNESADSLTEQFIGRFSIDIDELRDSIRSSRRFDEGFEYYGLEMLTEYPMIKIRTKNETSYISPIPMMVLHRISVGVFYDCMKARRDGAFSNRFGLRFEEMCGKILDSARIQFCQNFILSKSDDQVRNDPSDNKGKNVDWILHDDSAAIFFECKTYRIALKSFQSAFDLTELEKQLNVIAGSLLQTYQAVERYVRGDYSHFLPYSHTKPIYPIILVLKGYFLGMSVQGELKEKLNVRLKSLMQSKGVDLRLIEKYPYSFCSVADLKPLIFACAQKGISEVCGNKLTDAYVGYEFRQFLNEKYADATLPEDFKLSSDLFGIT